MIVVDDGSRADQRVKVLTSEFPIQVINLSQNCGKGEAVRRGFQNAKGEFVFFTDADIPFEFSCFEKGLDVLASKQADVVIGSRQLEGSKYFEAQSAIRKYSSQFYSYLACRLVLGCSKMDTQCGFKGFRKGAVQALFEELTIQGYAFDIELLAAIKRQGLILQEVPVQLRSMEGRGVNVLRDGPIMLYDLWRIHQSKDKSS